MLNIRTTLATLVAGGIVGAAGQASAAVNYSYYNIDPGTTPPADVSILGKTQFYYGEQILSKNTFLFTAVAGAGLGSLSTTYSLPGAGETYSNSSVQTAFKENPLDNGPEYLHLTFNNAGTQYVGTASFNGDAVLTRIAYEKLSDVAGGVPEPSSWALLIAGFGMAGVSMRRRRQTVSATA